MIEQLKEWSDTISTIGLSLAVFTIILLSILLARKLINILHRLHAGHVLIEITPAAFDNKSTQATSTLFSALHSLGSARTLHEKILGIHHSFSVEIISTKTSGIRYVIRTPKAKAKSVQNLIKSYASDAKTKSVDDYLPVSTKVKTLRFVAQNNYVYPLQSHESLDNHDPIGYITSAMTQLEDDEMIALQVVFEPRKLLSAGRIRKKILRNDTYLPNASNNLAWLKSTANAINKLNFAMMDAVTTSFHPAETYPKVATSSSRQVEHDMRVARGEQPARQLSYFEHEVVAAISEKLKQPLFRSDVRFIVSSTNRVRIKEHKQSIQSAMGLYEVPKYQGFRLRRSVLGKRVNGFMNERRIQSATRPLYLASSELAGLFHFPNSVSSKTEDVVKSLSKTLPAPLSLKKNPSLDVLIGENHHHGRTTPIGLTSDERERHMYVIGGTGNGKTTMLKYQIVQDMRAGKGLAVIDPHGDLAEELIGLVPEDRVNDVVYINPRDIKRPVAINLLELPLDEDGKPLEGDEYLMARDDLTEKILSVLRKFFSEDDTGGHRIEYVLRNAIHTALTVEGATLFTVLRLLNDTPFRKKYVNKLPNGPLKSFWKNEFSKAGGMQQVKLSIGATSKLGRFQHSITAERMLDHAKSSVDFDKLMDEGKILICNFSKGNLGEDTSRLFGVTVLAKLQLAALKRSQQHQSNRRGFHLYVDEFQNFATASFVQLLSEARKYKLFLTMAEQSTQQQDDPKIIEVILANVGTLVAFRSGSPKDEAIIRPKLGKRYIDEGELSNLPAFNFYAKILAIDAQEPMSGVTVVLDREPSSTVSEKVIRRSRNTYGVEVLQKKKRKSSSSVVNGKKLNRTIEPTNEEGPEEV